MLTARSNRRDRIRFSVLNAATQALKSKTAGQCVSAPPSNEMASSMALQRITIGVHCSGTMNAMYALGHRVRAAAAAESAFTMSPIRSNRTIKMVCGLVGFTLRRRTKCPKKKAPVSKIRSACPIEVRIRRFTWIQVSCPVKPMAQFDQSAQETWTRRMPDAVHQRERWH